MNVGQMLANAARRHPHRPAVTWGEHRLDYAALDRRTNALARGLTSLGLAPGDRVGVLMRNRPELIEAMFACFKGGFCLVPLNSRFTEDEVAYHVADSGAAAVLTDPEGADVVLGGVAGSPAPVRVVVAGDDPAPAGAHGHDDLVAATDDAPAAVAVDRDHLAWLFYTSGTTGRPKGAMLTHGNLSFVTASWLADLTPMTEADVTLHAAPLSHGAGFHALAATARGAHQIIPPGTRFDPAGHPRAGGGRAGHEHVDGADADRDVARPRRRARRRRCPISAPSSTAARRSRPPISVARWRCSVRCSSSCSRRARRR